MLRKNHLEPSILGLGSCYNNLGLFSGLQVRTIRVSGNVHVRRGRRTSIIKEWFVVGCEQVATIQIQKTRC